MKLFRHQQGLSLMEIMIGLAVAGIGMMAFMNFLKVAATSNKSVFDATSIKGDLQVFSRYVARAVTSGNLRFYAYTSSGEKFRLLVPLPELCVDLSQEALCKNDTALLFVKYDKTTTPAVSAICRIRQANTEYLIIDLNNHTYGAGKLNNGSVQVGRSSESSADAVLSSSKPIKLTKDSLISLLDPPFAYVWKVEQNAAPYAAKQKTDGTFEQIEYHGHCQERLKVKEIIDGKTFYHIDQLIAVPITPFTLSQYLDKKTPPALDLVTLNDTIFPLRTFNIELESLGRVKKGNAPELGIGKCKISSNKLSCQTKNGATIKNIERLRIDFKYKIALQSTEGDILSRDNWYEILAKSMTQSCTTSDCPIQPLFVSSVDEITYLSTVDETKESLLNSSFSLLKQEELENLRIRYQKSKQPKEESLNVSVP